MLNNRHSQLRGSNGAGPGRPGFNILLNPFFHSANTELISCLVFNAVIHCSSALQFVFTLVYDANPRFGRFQRDTHRRHFMTKQEFLRSARSLSVIALLILANLGLPARSFAQTDNGRIVGTVTDQANAAIPSATILIKNERTGETRSVTSNDQGIYLISPLKPSF